MTLYYIIAKSFFIWTEIQTNGRFWRWKKEEMPGWEENETRQEMREGGEEGRGCESVGGVWRKISWVSLKRWFLATPAPRKLNIDQSHRPPNNEGDKEEY